MGRSLLHQGQQGLELRELPPTHVVLLYSPAYARAHLLEVLVDVAININSSY